MRDIVKGKSIRTGLRKGFQNGTSKIAQRRCYGYDANANGELVIKPDEAAFDRYLSGDSLGKIAAGLEEQGVPSPTGKPRWNREAINKLISNEKYTGRVLLQKTVSAGGSKIKTMASWDGISIPAPMRPSFLMRCSWRYSRRSSSAPKIQKTQLP